MHKRLTAVLLSSGAAALALALGATTAMASSVATSWTVKPGGIFSFSGSGQVKDTKTTTVAKCTSIKLSGTLKSGSGLSGASIGTITSAAFTGCTIGGVIVVTVAVHGLPWEMNATSYSSTTGVTTGSIEDIDLVATGPNCNATLDGTAAGADNGLTKITYTNSTGKIKLLGAGGNLHSYGVLPGTCAGLINPEPMHDPQQASGSGLVTPKQTITSP
jgi:hypothetical protein